MILSISGAFLASSSHHRQRFFGYIIWIVSNGAIAITFWQVENWPMVTTFLLYEIFNIRGVWSNIDNTNKNKFITIIRG
jgi:hypothetical protein